MSASYGAIATTGTSSGNLNSSNLNGNSHTLARRRALHLLRTCLLLHAHGGRPDGGTASEQLRDSPDLARDLTRAGLPLHTAKSSKTAGGGDGNARQSKQQKNQMRREQQTARQQRKKKNADGGWKRRGQQKASHASSSGKIMPYLDNWLAFLSAYEVYEKEFEMHLVDQVWGTLPTLAAAVINDHRRRVLALIEGGSGAEASSSSSSYSSYSSYSSLTIDPTTRKTTKEDGTAATPMACFWEASLPPFTGPFFRLLLEASLRNENPTVVRHGLERFLDGSRTMDLKQALYRPIFKHVPALPSATGADEEEEEEAQAATEQAEEADASALSGAGVAIDEGEL